MFARPRDARRPESHEWRNSVPLCLPPTNESMSTANEDKVTETVDSPTREAKCAGLPVSVREVEASVVDGTAEVSARCLSVAEFCARLQDNRDEVEEAEANEEILDKHHAIPVSPKTSPGIIDEDSFRVLDVQKRSTWPIAPKTPSCCSALLRHATWSSAPARVTKAELLRSLRANAMSVGERTLLADIQHLERSVASHPSGTSRHGKAVAMLATCRKDLQALRAEVCTRKSALAARHSSHN